MENLVIIVINYPVFTIIKVFFEIWNRFKSCLTQITYIYLTGEQVKFQVF